jgi:hypothetical protein
MVHINANNAFVVKAPFGKGVYKVTIGVGDCHYISFPVLTLKSSTNTASLVASSSYPATGLNGSLTEFSAEIRVVNDGDTIEIYDPRDVVSGLGTGEERVVGIADPQPTRITEVRLQRISL